MVNGPTAQNAAGPTNARKKEIRSKLRPGRTRVRRAEADLADAFHVCTWPVRDAFP